MDCRHSLTVDIQNPPGDGLVIEGRDWWRFCLLCGALYNRTKKFSEVMRKQCDKAWRVNFGKIKLSDKDAIDMAL